MQLGTQRVLTEKAYSSGSAYRRIKAMRLCRDIPETKAQIESGKLNLSSASKLQVFFERQNEKQKRKLKKNSSESQNFSSQKTRLQKKRPQKTRLQKARP